MVLFFSHLKESAFRGKDRKKKSKSLLEQAALRYKEVEPSEHSTGGPLAYTKEGKPYWPGTAVKFSLSHSGNQWICLMAQQEVGLDIEEKKPRDYARIANHFFSPEEQEYVKKYGLQGFLQIWTRKEAYVKISGRKLLSTLKNVSMVEKGQVRSTVDCYIVKELKEFSGYICTCFYEHRESITLVSLDSPKSGTGGTIHDQIIPT